MIIESRENLHMAPPRYGESEFHVKNMGDGGFRSTSSVGAITPLTVGAWRVCGVIICDYWRLPGGDLNCIASMRVFLFLLIFGWSVRADLIRRPNLVKTTDFGENLRFPGFGSPGPVKMYEIFTSARDFCRFVVDHPGKNSQRWPGTSISWKMRWFPGFALIRSMGSSYESGSDKSTVATDF